MSTDAHIYTQARCGASTSWTPFSPSARAWTGTRARWPPAAQSTTSMPSRARSCSSSVVGLGRWSGDRVVYPLRLPCVLYYVHTHTYSRHLHMRILQHLSRNVDISTFMSPYLHLCRHIYIYVDISTYQYISSKFTHAYIATYLHLCRHIYICVDTSKYMYDIYYFCRQKCRCVDTLDKRST